MKKLFLILVFVVSTSFIEKGDNLKKIVSPIKVQTELDLLRIQRNHNRVLFSKKIVEYYLAEERLSKAIE